MKTPLGEGEGVGAFHIRGKGLHTQREHPYKKEHLQSLSGWRSSLGRCMHPGPGSRNKERRALATARTRPEGDGSSFACLRVSLLRQKKSLPLFKSCSAVLMRKSHVPKPSVVLASCSLLGSRVFPTPLKPLQRLRVFGASQPVRASTPCSRSTTVLQRLRDWLVASGVNRSEGAEKPFWMVYGSTSGCAAVHRGSGAVAANQGVYCDATTTASNKHFKV